MKKTLITTAVIVASTTSAFAYGREVAYAAQYVHNMTKDGSASRLTGGAGACAAEVKEAREANQPLVAEIFQEFGGTKTADGSYQITYDQADAICRDAGMYSDVVFKDIDLFKDIAGKIHALVDNDWSMDAKDSMPTDYLAKLEPPCSAAVAALAAAKVPASARFHLDHVGIETVGDLQAKLCDRAKDLGLNYWKHREEAEKKALEPYLKAGIKGDRLDLMLEYGGSLFLPGKRAPNGLKPYATAPVMFTWSTSDPDDAGYVVHTVRKYVFKGNTLVRTSEKNYRMKSGAEPGGSAFK